MSIPKFFIKVYNDEISGYTMLRSNRLFDGKNKAVVISFFASYCEPCKKEIFLLNEFYDKYRDNGVLIIEISIDTEQEGIDIFKSLVDKSKFTMPCVIDSMGTMSCRFGVDKLPTLFVIDKYGYIKDNIRDFEKAVLNLISDEKAIPDGKSLLTDNGQRHILSTKENNMDKKESNVK